MVRLVSAVCTIDDYHFTNCDHYCGRPDLSPPEDAMTFFERTFLKQYGDRDFMLQQKAKVLMYFVLIAAILLLVIFALSNLFLEKDLFSGRNLMRLALIAVTQIALLLLRNGRYHTAANFVLISSTLIFGVQTVLDPFHSAPELIIRVLYLFIFILIAAVFCGRTSTVLTAVLLLAIFCALVYRNSAILSVYMKPLVISFSSCLLFIATLVYLLLSIVAATLKKIAENDEREKQHAALSKMMCTVREVTDKLSSLTEVFSAENNNLSERTLAQAASIEQIAATMEEISESISKSTENTVDVRRLASQSAKSASDGVTLVQQVISSIGDIEKTSRKIADITTMINEISFNTNLLALNAAVEAARAGESGRGFAVVAGEVRNLAQRAAGASKEIDALVKESINAVLNGTVQVRQSGDFIKNISEAVNGVSRGISDIALTAGEQKSGIEQVNSAVIEIDNSTQQNSILVEKNTSVGAEISEQVRLLVTLLSEIEEA